MFSSVMNMIKKGNIVYRGSVDCAYTVLCN